MSYITFRNGYLAEAATRLSAVTMGTATTNELLAAGALYNGNDQRAAGGRGLV